MTSTAIDLSAIRTDQSSYKGTFRALIGVYSSAEVDALIAGVGVGSVVWGDIGGTLANQTDLQNALNAKASSSHTHSQSDITNLASDLALKASIVYVDAGLATKAAASHTHAQSDVTNLTADLAAKQATLVSGTNIKTVNSTSLLGSGDVSVGTIGGSTGATDNRVVRVDGTGGSTIQGSAVTIDDSGNVSGVGSLTVDSFGTGDSALIIETFTDPANTSVKAARLRTASSTRRLYIGNSSNAFYSIHFGGVSTVESFPQVTSNITCTSGNISASSGSVSASTFMQTGVYTFATVPSASANTGKFIRISDRAQKHAYSDGTNWRFFGDDAIIS